MGELGHYEHQCVIRHCFFQKSFFFLFGEVGRRGGFGLIVTLHIASGFFEFGGLFFFFWLVG